MPTALYKSNKDSRNNILWQPSETSLKNVEVDEAGKLAAFRERFGRNWDMDGGAEGGAAGAVEGKNKADGKVEAAAAAAPAAPEAAGEDPFDSLVDLISSYSKNDKALGGKTAKEEAKEEAAAKKKK